MQKNVILCVSGIALKTKHSYSMISLWKNNKEQKVLGVITHNKLNFKSHICELCKKSAQKIEALCRLSSYLHNSEKKLMCNSIVKLQFS